VSRPSWASTPAGDGRFATAAAVSQHRGIAPEEAFVATSEDFPDVLAAAPAAISADAGLLLAGQGVLPEATRTELQRLGVQRATIAGGESAVSEAVVDEIRRTLGFDPGPAGEVTVEFFDVGQADSALVSTGDTEILVDTGGIRGGDVTSRLADAGVTDEVDVLALTHWHADHIGQVPEVLDAVDVDKIWHQPGEHDSATYDDAIAAIEASDATVRQPRQGETHTIGDLTVDIVGPSELADFDNPHDAMLAFRIEHGDARVLFTADAESETEARYVNRVPELLSAQLYQVGHHRSRTGSSQALLDAVQPDTAVYSAAADSQYGQPHAEALDRLNAAGAEIFGTDVNGTVTAASDGSPSWTVTPEREGTPPARRRQ
jgi:beta-lactamase superfamily II metal-dependent hydrolase